MSVSAEATTLEEILFNKDMNFELPRYQRKYVWGIKPSGKPSKVTELLNDIQETISDPAIENKFIGAVMFHDPHPNRKSAKEIEAMNLAQQTTEWNTHFPGEPLPSREQRVTRLVALRNDKKPQIIDGQQRLVTLTILLRLMHDKLGSWTGAAAIKDEIKEFYTPNKTRYGLTAVPSRRIGLRGDDNINMQNIIDNGENNTTWEGDTQGKKVGIKLAFTTINEWLNQQLVGCGPRSHARRDFFTNTAAGTPIGLFPFIKQSLQLIRVDVEHTLQAHDIFMSLNSKGQSLTTAQLLKSYSLQKARSFSMGCSNNVSGYWERIETILEEHPKFGTSFDVDSDFLYRNALSLGQDVKENDVFHYYKEMIMAFPVDTDLEAFLNNLEDDAARYVRVFRPDGSRYGGIEYDLLDFKAMNFKQHIHVFMAANRSHDAVAWSPGKLEELSNRFGAYLVRAKAVGKSTTGEEKLYRKFAKLICDHGENAISTTLPPLPLPAGAAAGAVAPPVENIRQLINQKCVEARVTDAGNAFRDAVLDAGIMEADAKYILRRVFGLGGYPFTYSTYQLHAEHIAPKNHDNWPINWVMPHDRRDAIKHKIGNYLILEQKLNISASNKKWSQKKAHLRQSAIVNGRVASGLVPSVAGIGFLSNPPTYHRSKYPARAISERGAWRQWYPEDIADRTLEIANAMVTIWPL